MRALCLAVALAMALATGSSTHAWADDHETIALLSLEISGDAPPELRQQVQAHIAKGLAQSHTVIGLDETQKTLATSPELIGCFSSECLERIGEALSIRRFVRAVLVASGAHYELKLDLMQTGSEELLLNSVTTSCSICTISDLNERTQDAASQLLVLDAEKLMEVTIASIPDGAVISIDGLEAGTSPVETELAPGPHRVRAAMEGYVTSAKTIEVLAAATTGQRFELPLVEPLVASTSAPPDYGYWKWGSVAASGVLLVLGTTLIVIDDDPTCDSSTEQCPFLRQTMLGGVLSISGSVLTGAAAGWMFWDESRESRKRRTSLSLIPGGATAGMAFEF